MARSAAARLSTTTRKQYRIAKAISTSKKPRSRSLDNVITAAIGECQHNLPSPQSSDFHAKKRKCQEWDEQHSPADEPRTKKRRISIASGDKRSPCVDQSDLIGHWVQNDCEWSNFLKETTTMDEKRRGRAEKRSLSRSNSYRQSTISGDTPKAWGVQHAAIMLETGIYMERQNGATITEQDDQLCKKILQARYDLPAEWRFQGDNFLTIVNQALYKNECRVVRDLGPHIMPSPELLKAQGHSGLDYIAEALDAQWVKCTSLCGPRSKPDVTHGVSRLVFTREEREKLTSNNTCACEAMMFPFFICEAKRFDKSIEESELQALHGASVAGNTVIELYEKLGTEKQLDRRILAFSVSHNQRVVKIFAHFALIDGNKTTFHRHRIFQTDLIEDADNRTRPYQIALAIWQHFYPIHLRRIQHALAQQRSRAMDSFTAQLGFEDSSESGRSTPVSSHDDSQAVVKLQEEIFRLLNSIREQQDESRQQREEHKKQTEQQQEEARQQKEESRQQRILLERQLEQMQQDARQQKEEARQQRDELRQQMVQQKMIIELLQRKSTER